MLLVHVEAAQSEEDRLIRAAAEGDRGAFGELYSRYARMVHGILLARVPAGDAEDLVQDVFMSAMKQLRVLRTAAAFRGPPRGAPPHAAR
jgi:RNA polymerase sigma-70 factor (ECF subfamily)